MARSRLTILYWWTRAQKGGMSLNRLMEAAARSIIRSMRHWRRHKKASNIFQPRTCQGGHDMMRSMVFAALLSRALPCAALAQTNDDLKNDANTPSDVLVYGMGYSGQRYSPLTRINKDNVSKLVPVWAYSLA